MIRINNISVPLDFKFTDENLINISADELKIKSSGIKSAKLSKKSVDARKKNKRHMVQR